MHVALLGHSRRSRRRQPQLGTGLPVPLPSGITSGTPFVLHAQAQVVFFSYSLSPAVAGSCESWHEGSLFLAGEVWGVEECTGRAGQAGRAALSAAQQPAEWVALAAWWVVVSPVAVWPLMLRLALAVCIQGSPGGTAGSCLCSFRTRNMVGCLSRSSYVV
jgi:hypothetical protein